MEGGTVTNCGLLHWASTYAGVSYSRARYTWLVKSIASMIQAFWRLLAQMQVHRLNMQERRSCVLQTSVYAAHSTEYLVLPELSCGKAFFYLHNSLTLHMSTGLLMHLHVWLWHFKHNQFSECGILSAERSI